MVILRNFGARRYAQCLCADRQLRHCLHTYLCIPVNRLHVSPLNLSLSSVQREDYVTTFEFIDIIAKNLVKKIQPLLS